MFIAIAVAVVVVAAVAWKYRANLKADVKAAEAKLDVYKSGIKQEIATAISDVKAWDAKAEGKAKDALEQIEARIKQIL